MKNDNLIFVDTETTGLDPNKGHLLELAVVAVKLPTFAVEASYTQVIRPPMWETVKRNLPERVLKMHTDSGLIAEIDALEAPNLVQVEIDATVFVRKFAPQTMDWQTPLCGAGPDFDRRWLARHMPKLLGCFHYRNFDVRSITQLQDWCFGVEHVDSPHRALPDCIKAIQDVRDFLGL